MLVHPVTRSAEPRAVSPWFMLLAAVAALLCLSSGTGMLSAQCPMAKITEPVSNDLDDFGVVVALEGDLAAVAERGVLEDGTVHVFQREGVSWVHKSELLPLYTHVGQQFGNSLALSGGTLVVGAQRDDEYGPNAGAAYVFERDDAGTPGDPTDDSWVQTFKLYPPGPSDPTLLGCAVDVEGDTVLVGARGGPFRGEAWVYQRNDQGTPSPLDDSWTRRAKLAADGLSPTTDFGRAVQLTPDEAMLLVGDTLDSTSHQGAVATFFRNDQGTPGDPHDDTWAPGAKIQLAPGSDPNSTLGSAFAHDAGTVLCGAPGGGPVWNGVAYFFDRSDPGTPADPFDDSWSLTATMAGAGVIAGFGESVALEGDRALVGAPSFQMPPWRGHSAFAYQRTGGVWGQQQQLYAPDEQAFDFFGVSVALSGSRALIGAHGREYVDDWAPAEGAAYEFDLARPSPWANLGHGFWGIPEPQLSAWGWLEHGTPVSLRLYNGIDSAVAWLVIGFSRIDLPYKGGVLVPATDLIVPSLICGAWGDLTLSGPWTSAGILPPGTEVYFQYLEFSPFFFPPPGVRASNALRATQP